MGILSELNIPRSAASSFTEVSPDQVTRSQPVLLLMELDSDRPALFSEIELFKIGHPAGNIALLADREQSRPMSIILRNCR
jgi:hypothetical protein